MRTPEVYWIWLQQALNVACKEVAYLLEFFTSAKVFYEEGPEGWRSLGCFSEKQLKALRETSLEKAEAVYHDAVSRGYTVITPEQSRYPKSLRQLVDPPAVLYGKGELPDFDRVVAVAVVGTRTASPYGLKVAYDISADLCSAGVVIVSGGALGVDISAHKGALSVDGVTVSVLGCGINYPYLMENAGIRAAISIKGAVLTEYPPSTPPLPHHFPIRNRLISGLSQGTLVVEAAQKSGSLITASRALEQGKDIFAIPGDIAAITSRGANELIQSGAKAVLSAEDILEEYRTVYPGRIASPETLQRDSVPHIDRRTYETAPKKEKKTPWKDVTATKEKKPSEVRPDREAAHKIEALSEKTAAFYKALSSRPQHLDELTEAAGLTPAQALCAVTELELLGCLRTQSGKRYSRAE